MCRCCNNSFSSSLSLPSPHFSFSLSPFASLFILSLSLPSPHFSFSLSPFASVFINQDQVREKKSANDLSTNRRQFWYTCYHCVEFSLSLTHSLSLSLSLSLCSPSNAFHFFLVEMQRFKSRSPEKIQVQHLFPIFPLLNIFCFLHHFFLQPLFFSSALFQFLFLATFPTFSFIIHLLNRVDEGVVS